MTDSLLLVDDDADVLRSIGDYFERLGYEVFREPTGEGGVSLYERHRPDVVVLDLDLPDLHGLEVLERLRARDAAVLLLTGHGDVQSAVQAMQLGAENFLVKPVDMPHLAAAVARAGEKVRLRRENELLRGRGGAGHQLDALGVSLPMRELARQIELLAVADRTTVLLTGESGTGKGWVAGLIHRLSPRATAPFVDVNCAGLTATFLNSELFGHERGAFTGAEDRKLGLFELANRGSVFLDEIGDLDVELQPKLLGVLESKTFRRLGGTRPIGVDVRLITATNHDLVADVGTGRFREDLYYRLSVMPLHLPPLRERSREDLLLLINRLLDQLRQEVTTTTAGISPAALQRLLAYHWPGNVRELRNVLERTLIVAGRSVEIGVDHLPAELRQRAAAERRFQPTSLAEVERVHIERTLRHHGGNRTRAARDLGISRATLINKIKTFQLDL